MSLLVDAMQFSYILNILQQGLVTDTFLCFTVASLGFA